MELPNLDTFLIMTPMVIEPNGYNPGLKMLERFSTYHRQHDEKSYAPAKLQKWVEELDGTISKRVWAGFVPMFCPDWLARITKFVEPAVERLPLIRNVGCAVFVFSATKKND